MALAQHIDGDQVELERPIVASYRSYDAAQRAVDHLADNGFPVERVSIVGEGMRLVKHVTGAFSYRAAAVEGMILGAAVGAVLGFVVGFFSLIDPLVSGILLALNGVLFGGIAGLIVSPLMSALRRGRRHSRAAGRLQVKRYEVRADPRVADRARWLIEARLISPRLDA